LFRPKVPAVITMAHNKPREFFVVLTNRSTKSQEIFESWNSWGYQTISFELTMRDGQKIVISVKQQDFLRNFPSTFVIKPGEHQVFPIRLDQRWAAMPTLRKVNEQPVKLKAIYEVLPTPEAAQEGVWIGRIESHEYKLTLRQW
jgi:hypothetical protein